MIVKYDTSALPGSKSSGGNLLIYALILGTATWAAHKFWWVPRQEKKKKEETITAKK